MAGVYSEGLFRRFQRTGRHIDTSDMALEQALMNYHWTVYVVRFVSQTYTLLLTQVYTGLLYWSNQLVGTLCVLLAQCDASIMVANRCQLSNPHVAHLHV